MIDWKRVWKEYAIWLGKKIRTWPEQKRKLRKLVEKHSVYYNDYETD